MNVDPINEGMNSLIRTGYFGSRGKLLNDAFGTILEVRPTLKTERVVELYKTEKISLSRAAEISGTSVEGFESVLEQRGITRIVKAPSNDKIKKGVALIIG